MTEFDYQFLTAGDQRTLERERLLRIEADHYRLTLETRIAALVAPDQPVDGEILLRLAALEVQANALRSWINGEKTVPNEVPV